MDYQNQNQQNRDEQGSAQQNQNKQSEQSQRDWPTSAGGNTSYDDENENDTNMRSDMGNMQDDDMQSDAQRPESRMREDATSRLRDDDEDEMDTQIDSEGEFEDPDASWTREEGLSDEERRQSEEEDFGGRSSRDGSIL
jgi:hypothetical protein